MRCARFEYGIYKNPHYQGLYHYGADIAFRRWAKLESVFEFGAAGTNKTLWLDRLDRMLQAPVNLLGTFLAPINKNRRINGAYHFLRRRFLRTLTASDRNANLYDEFIIEVWNPADSDVQLIIECQQDVLRFRDSITLSPGHNLHKIDFKAMDIDLNKKEGLIRVYPDGDAECRLVFSWLDFVKYKNQAADSAVTSNEVTPQASRQSDKKIKCVIWDLDNTLWEGILGEVGLEGVEVRSYIVDIIKTLDERGIIQSISSKNDHEHAWEVISKIGLDEYFLYPAINWKPKSENIKQIIKELNINEDTFAFIDDSPFERAQVESELPAIRTYDPLKLEGMFERPEFDVTVTEESKNRRSYYQAESQRKGFSEDAAGDYNTFLRQCNMQAEVFAPESEKDISRCLELLQRSNQLNLTTHRYEEAEFLASISNSSIRAYAIRVEDRFGEYGIVGVALIDMSGQDPLVTDFVISCRVAQKKLEHAWFSWVANNLYTENFNALHAIFLPTERNHILLDVLTDIGFKEISKDAEEIHLSLDVSAPVPDNDIVKIISS